MLAKCGLPTTFLLRKLRDKDGKENGGNLKKSSFRVLEAKNVKKLLYMGGPTKRDSTTEKKFNIGETVSVRTNNSNTKVEKGHTRLPDYVKGRTGKVIAYHGSHVFPDANAHFLGERPEDRYTAEIAEVMDTHPGYAHHHSRVESQLMS